MKKLLCLLLSLTLLCGCGAPVAGGADQTTTAPEQTRDPNAPLTDGKTLKLLAVTSSFGLNTTQFLYEAAVDQGCTDVVVGRLYASGCTLKMHAQWAKDANAGYQYTKIKDGAWSTVEGADLKFGMQDEDWDIIFVQQSAADAGIAGSYGNYIDELMPYIKQYSTNQDARYVWNMTWAYQGDSTQSVFVNAFVSDQQFMYDTIVSVTQEKLGSRTDFDRIIPTGTAVQNARTSYFGDTLTKDTYHLNNLGRAIAGYMLYATLTGQPLSAIDPGPLKSYDLPDTLELTEADKAVIIESVNHALAEPYKVTQSQYTQTPG